MISIASLLGLALVGITSEARAQASGNPRWCTVAAPGPLTCDPDPYTNCKHQFDYYKGPSSVFTGYVPWDK